MDNGKTQLLEYVARIHPAQEFSPLDLEPGGTYALPGGFAITSNPFAVSTQVDPHRVTLFGPLDTAVALPTLELFGGRVVIRGIALLQAIARLVETGPPVWSRRPGELADWWKAQIATSEPFTVPDAAPQTRQEMESHIESCSTCQPVSQALISAIDAGSTAYGDEHIREMISKAHDDPRAAVEFYESKRAALAGLPTVSAKRRKAAAVLA